MKQLLNIGNVVDDGTGDYLREGGLKLNNNFNELYTELGDGSIPHPAGAWTTIKSADSNLVTVKFGKSYAIDTTSAAMTIKLPKGSSTDYNKVIRIRDTFSTWQTNSVTVSPASGDTLKGSSLSKKFSSNLTDLEFVYCAPGRWEFIENKKLNKIASDTATTVARKEFICTAGQTTFKNIFDTVGFNLKNTNVYLRGNLLYYGDKFSDNSDYGSPDSKDNLVALDGMSIKLRYPANEGDTLVVVTYLDGITQWRSTYNRLDAKILDKSLSNLTTVKGSTIVKDLTTYTTIAVEDLGYTLTSNSGLINPETLEVYINGLILNEAGTAGMPTVMCSGATADNQTDCEMLGGSWVQSNYDYLTTLDSNGAVDTITFGRQLHHEDIVTIKWYNNDIGTTLELDDIIAETDDRYIQQGPTYSLTGQVRITNYDNPTIANTENLGTTSANVRTPNDMFDLIYPIGTIYENAINPNNPSTYMGMGTWKLWGQKQFLAGWANDNADSDFGLNKNNLDANKKATLTAGGTGGNRSITIANSNLPATSTDEKVLIADTNGAVIIGGCQFDPDDSGPAYNKYREEAAKTNATQVPPKSIDILPPYVTVYRWMRIA